MPNTVDTRLKRPRPVVSCLECRRKKLKCDRLLPCQQCLKGDRAQVCAYAPGQNPELRDNVQTTGDSPSQAHSHSHQHDSDSGSGHDSRRVNDLLARLQGLEQDLNHEHNAASISNANNEDQHQVSGRTSPRFDTRVEEPENLLVNSCEKRTVLSHFSLASQFIQSLPAKSHNRNLSSIAVQIRALHRLTRPSEVRVATCSEFEDVITRMLRMLPNHDVCGKLVHLYFDNFEHCHRILHKSIFLRQNNQFWSDELTRHEKHEFLPLLIGVLSIAASLNTLPECKLPALHDRTGGNGAVQLLESWLALLPQTKAIGISALQVRLLSLQPQKSQHRDITNLWIESGRLVRHAMILGLHQQPPPPHLDNIQCEIRRRLWLTILEQDLALSITCNMPPNSTSYDILHPSNVNDEDMVATEEPRLQSRPSDEWTDGLCQCVLARTFNDRLQAYHMHFPGNASVKYPDAMRLAQSLETVLRELPKPFKLDQNNPPGRLLAQIELDITLRRPLIALYAPFAQAAPANDYFRDARIAWVQSNLVVLCYQDLFDPQYPAIDVPRPEGYWEFYYAAYRRDVVTALHAELLELQTMKSPRPNPPDTRGRTSQQHVANPHSRTLGFTIEGMMKSIEETIEPMARQLGGSGPDLRDVVLATIIFDSLCLRLRDDIDSFIEMGLTQLIKTIQSRLAREGYQIDIGNAVIQDSPTASRNSIEQSNLSWLANFLQNPEDIGTSS